MRKEYKMFGFKDSKGKWLFHLVDIHTWNEVILTESQITKCINHGVRIIV